MTAILAVLALLGVGGGWWGWNNSTSHTLTCTQLAKVISENATQRGMLSLDSKSFPVPGLEDTAELVVLGNPREGTAEIHILIPEDIPTAADNLENSRNFTRVSECRSETGNILIYLVKKVVLPPQPVHKA